MANHYVLYFLAKFAPSTFLFRDPLPPRDSIVAILALKVNEGWRMNGVSRIKHSEVLSCGMFHHAPMHYVIRIIDQVLKLILNGIIIDIYST